MFAIICTRDKGLSAITTGLCETLSDFGVSVKVLAKQDSIFSAYKKGLEACNAGDKDIIIFCHDDIQIKNTAGEFIAVLTKCLDDETGIIGPAGTTHLGEDAIWWKQDRWSQGLHRGIVHHYGKDGQVITKTVYGQYGQVVALDGLFLAARKEVWETICLDKPPYFPGLWDFYDIHYTTRAHKLGFKNYAMPFNIIHLSRGELVGRDSWHKNREAFINQTPLPIII